MTYTGPIVGGTHDREQLSRSKTRCELLAKWDAPMLFDPRAEVPATMTTNHEQFRFVAFWFTFPDRDVRTGFWVCLNEETARFRDDAEFRLFILTKLSERYTESAEAIKNRLFDLYKADRS